VLPITRFGDGLPGFETPRVSHRGCWDWTTKCWVAKAIFAGSTVMVTGHLPGREKDEPRGPHFGGCHVSARANGCLYFSFEESPAQIMAQHAIP